MDGNGSGDQRPIVQRYTVTLGKPVSIPPDPTRYLIAFWGSSGSVQVAPDSEGGEGIDSTNLNSGQVPLIISAQNHGAMPAMGWRISNGGPDATVTVILGQKTVLPPASGNGNGRIKLTARVTPRR